MSRNEIECQRSEISEIMKMKSWPENIKMTKVMKYRRNGEGEENGNGENGE
jgi:hypothetical protein